MLVKDARRDKNFPSCHILVPTILGGRRPSRERFVGLDPTHPFGTAFSLCPLSLYYVLLQEVLEPPCYNGRLVVRLN